MGKQQPPKEIEIAVILEFNLVNCCKPPQERDRIALTFRNAVLDFFGGVENAQKSYSAHCRNPEKPFQDWAYAYHNAMRQTRPMLSAWERGHTSFFPTFH
jgi:hypothetical protein